MPARVAWTGVDTPVGRMFVYVRGGRLVGLTLEEAWRHGTERHIARHLGRVEFVEDAIEAEPIARQVREYFAGERRTFDVQMEMLGTEFQRAVWGAVAAVPFGQTRSYAQVAIEIGQPSATRAVGAANGANPLPLVVPCHRIIGANGSLTGFGGGLPMKEWLLRHEGALTGQPTFWG